MELMNLLSTFLHLSYATYSPGLMLVFYPLSRNYGKHSFAYVYA